MRIGTASPLLLLLGSSLIGAADLPARGAAAVADAASNPPSVSDVLNVKKDAAEPVTGAARPNSAATKPYRGTEDAPVDGHDGKPHTGPFVDTTPDKTKAKTTKDGVAVVDATTNSKTRPTSLERFAEASGDDKWRLEDIPETNDGVMNDVNRVAPKKGTTGTEGGISEKEKERRFKQGLENKPQAPAEAPPLPHSEQQRIDEQSRTAERPGSRAAVKDDDRTADATVHKGGEYGIGGIGLEKPSDLPSVPHPAAQPPQPKSGSSSSSSKDVMDNWPVKDLRETRPVDSDTGDAPHPPSLGSSNSDAYEPSDDEEDEATWHEWFHSFGLSFTMILFSEIGDKTFLVAALMAMRHARLLVFTAALGALTVMTVLSAVLGHAVPALLPQRITTLAAALLFLVFGARMLREGLAMPPDTGVGDEMREVEAELEEQEHSMAVDRSRRRAGDSSSLSPYSLEAGRGRSRSASKHDFMRGEPSPPASRSPSPGARSSAAAKKRPSSAGLVNLCSLVLSPAWVQTFVMTFLGEWGDRSQIATIAMAAGQDYWWVTLGAITGHACCTGVAVIGGRALAGRVSMRMVTIGGALAFLVFGVIYLYECISESA